MKLQNIILSSLLAFQSVNANTISNKVFNYNFYCVKDNKGICSTLEKEVVQATNSLANILGKIFNIYFYKIFYILLIHFNKKKLKTIYFNNKLYIINIIYIYIYIFFFFLIFFKHFIKILKYT